MMKKIKYLVLAFVFSVCFIGGVNAANYAEGEWKNPTCGDYQAKFEAAYTDYKFDAETGKFTTAGTTFAASTSNQPVKTYEVQDDGTTLVIYVVSYDNNKEGMTVIKNLPEPTGGKCGDAYYTATKTAVAASDSSGENNNSGTSDGSSTSGDDSTTSGEDDGTISGDEDDENNNSNNNNNSTSTGDSTVKTTENPRTGITTVFLFLIPAALAGGTILVLKKKNMFGF